ncbi:MAG TPA: sugar ABC transporter permease [Anaerolineales bacterium]|nr:sugar ABC transporter permease [Anaerolineales bacterium]
MTATSEAASRSTTPLVPTGRRASRDQLTAIAVILPSILATAVFVYGFIAWSLRVSVSNWTGLLPDYSFAGLRQYLELARDARFAIDVRNTVIFTVLFLVSCIAIGLFLATLLDQRLRGENLFRSIFLFPMAISFIVTGVAWRWLMNSATGSRISGLNLLFQQLGVDGLINEWHLTDPPWGIAFIVIPAVWQMSGFTMALYLGGLRSISDDLREAARVDGASEFQIYRHILLPLLQPVTLSAVIILGHISLKIFDLIVAISQNNIALDVPSVYMWRTTFDGNNYGRGAAIGILMLIAVGVMIVPYLIYSMRSEAEL